VPLTAATAVLVVASLVCSGLAQWGSVGASAQSRLLVAWLVLGLLALVAGALAARRGPALAGAALAFVAGLVNFFWISLMNSQP
jgi:hypothetical protein